MICSIMEYVTPTWDPHWCKNINMLESVQKWMVVLEQIIMAPILLPSNILLWQERTVSAWNNLSAWSMELDSPTAFNTLRLKQNGRHFTDDTFKHIFLNENVVISIKISLKFIPKGLIYNIPALVQIMAWHRPGDKPLSEPMIIILLTYICVTRPQWVKADIKRHFYTQHLLCHN